MNIFDDKDICINKIYNCEKICQPYGFTIDVAPYRKGYKHNGQVTGFFTLALVLDGESEYFFENKTLHAEKGHIIFLDNHTPFKQRSLSDFYFYVINFVAQSGFIRSPNIFSPVDYEKYLSLFKEAAAVREQKKPGSDLLIISILYKILSVLKADYAKLGTPKSKNDRIMFAIEYIKQNISNSQLSVERIADEMNISSTYLRRIFTEITGVSPLQYIKNMRINLASDILCTKEISIADAAAECGFHDVSYFCKEFRKIIGCTPLAFKKKQHVTRAKI